MAGVDGEGRPTTATIDRRVERLEAAQAETDRKVDQLALKMDYMSELVNLKFTSIEAAQSAQATKLDAFMQKIDNLIAESLRSAADIRAQPLGRMVDDRLLRLEAKAEQVESFIDKASGLGATVRGYVLPILSLAVAAGSWLVWVR